MQGFAWIVLLFGIVIFAAYGCSEDIKSKKIAINCVNLSWGINITKNILQ